MTKCTALVLFFLGMYTGFAFGSTDPEAASGTSHFTGRVVMEDGAPVSGITVLAADLFHDPVFTLTDSNGCFNLTVFAEMWAVRSDPLDLKSKGLIAPSLPLFEIADNMTISNVDILVRKITGSIVGQVRDTANVPLSDLWVNCGNNIDGYFYEADATTDSNGRYELKVCNGLWGIATDYLGFRGYDTPTWQETTILNSTNLIDFVVNPLAPLQWVTFEIPNAPVGKPYSFQLKAVGGTSVYFWRLSSGSLPPGLKLAPWGHITGVPTQSTNALFTVTCSDDGGEYLEKTFPLTTFVPFGLTMALLPSATQVELQLTGETNKNYVIEYTPQLSGTNWTPVFTNKAVNGSILVTNAVSPDSTRFYRARLH